MQRYFAINKDLKLDKSDLHHIINVMRMKKDDQIKIIYNKKTYLCNIDKIKDNNIDTSIVSKVIEDNELSLTVTIAQSLVKEDKLSYIIQKLTELGVHSIIPVNTERSIIKIKKDKELNRIKRWNKIVKEAAEQSHRTIIPHIYPITNINEINSSNYDLKIVCSVNEKTKSVKQIIQKVKKYDKILIVIGPEGGFTPNEEQILVNNGFIMVSLGNCILRTETASLFIMSIINYETMR